MFYLRFATIMLALVEFRLFNFGMYYPPTIRLVKCPNLVVRTPIESSIYPFFDLSTTICWSFEFPFILWVHLFLLISFGLVPVLLFTYCILFLFLLPFLGVEFTYLVSVKLLSLSFSILEVSASIFSWSVDI